MTRRLAGVLPPVRAAVWRFGGLIAQNFSDLIKLNLLFSLCALPSAALLLLGQFGIFGAFAPLLSLAVSLPAGGALCACLFCLTKMFSGKTGHIWFDFRRKFLENVRKASVCGILYTAFIYFQVHLWSLQIFGDTETDVFLCVIGIGFLLFFGMLTPYIFLQIAYIDIKMAKIIKNSILISSANALRSFFGAVSGAIVWISVLLFLPTSLIFAPILMLTGFSLSWLLNLMWIWPPFDKLFAISETLRIRETNTEAVAE